MKNKKTEKKVISINLGIKLINKIDKLRDGIPRSLYISKILEKIILK